MSKECDLITIAFEHSFFCSRFYYFQLQRYFRHKRNHKLNSVTQRVDNNLMELNFLNANDRDIDVNLGIIKSNNQISASKIQFGLSF